MNICQVLESESKTIYTLCRGRKDDPVSWLQEQEVDRPQDWIKIDRRIKFLAERGMSGNEQHYRYIKPYEIWEIKGGSLRMLFFEDGTNVILLVSGFHKPNPKEQRAEFRRASEIRDEYFTDKQLGQIRISIAPGERLFFRAPAGAERFYDERDDSI